MADVKELFVDLTKGRDVVVNRFLSAGYTGGQHCILLVTRQGGLDADGKLADRWAIVSRIRFDTEMAVILRDALNTAIETVSAPPDQKPN